MKHISKRPLPLSLSGSKLHTVLRSKLKGSMNEGFFFDGVWEWVVGRVRMKRFLRARSSFLFSSLLFSSLFLSFFFLFLLWLGLDVGRWVQESHLVVRCGWLYSRSWLRNLWICGVDGCWLHCVRCTISHGVGCANNVISRSPGWWCRVQGHVGW